MTEPWHGWTLFFIVVTISGCLYSGSNGAESEWDQFVLSLQWPFTACMKMRCVDKWKKPMWTIHGLWPGYSTKTGCPPGCSDARFDVDIRANSRLLQSWPDLSNNDPSKFWEYEWNKHGKCALQANVFETCRDYFFKTADLAIKYNPIRAMEHFNPSNNRTYQTKKVQETLRRHYSKTVLLRCYVENGKYYLGEIHLCFTKSLELKDCTTKQQCGTNDVIFNSFKGRYTDCSPSESLYYPSEQEEVGRSKKIFKKERDGKERKRMKM